MKPLTKEEKFVCEMTWGGVPVDTDYVRESKLFNEYMKKFKNGDYKEIFNNENKK